MEKTSPDAKNAEETIAEHANERKKLYPVVAIGASAGGLEALSTFLQHIPADLGFVYVVIQHLSPSHESILPELLERRTKMPVHKVEHSMPIQPDHVYVIPPNAYMSIIDSKLTLSSRSEIAGGNYSIDFFMTALAAVYHNLAVGVVLSGTATDGTEGIKHIKAEGGVTFAQDGTAKFQGMPQSAANSGFVDFVLSPEGIANELKNIVDKPSGDADEAAEGNRDDDAEIKIIQLIVSNRKGVDFTFYKQPTIQRRILRRMALNKMTRLSEYTHMLRIDSAELDLLYRDLLINVTCFFREPDVFEALATTVFPALIKDRKLNDPIRIWCPACATGEEAASIAICLREFLKRNTINIPIQVFGTDLSESSIDKARAGLYAPATLQNVSPERLKKYFVKVDGKFQISKVIRDVCIFATQNLLKDPPFSRMDLISCQNVMIYIEAGPQKKILQSFHYGLKPTGFLLLGKSESIGSATHLFAQAHKELKIYEKQPVSINYSSFDFVFRRPQQEKEAATIATDDARHKEPAGMIDIEKETERLLLSRYVPASIVINADYQIFRFHGPVHKYLQPTSGKASLHLLKMVLDDLVYELRSLVQQVKKEGRLIRKENISVLINEQRTEINIEVVPIKANAREAYYLILFDEKPTLVSEVPDINKMRTRKPGEYELRLAELEIDKKDAQLQMKTMTEEYEAAREELQSANEEVLSSNEELQSINEELETSKEELQSTNEELITINDELLIRNIDLKEVMDYSVAIVETIREPLLLLDANMRIRTANKAFYSAFGLAQQHVEGQFLYEIDNTRWNVPELLTTLNEVGNRKNGFLTFEQTQLYKDKILVFNVMNLAGDSTSKGMVRGNRILITIQDVTLQRQVQETRSWLAAVVGSSGEGIISFTVGRKVISWNRGAEEIFGYTDKEMIGSSISKLITKDDRLQQQYITERVIKGEVIRQHETAWLHKEGHIINVSISVSPIINDNGFMLGLTASVQDITTRKQTEETLKTAQLSLQVALEAANMGIWEWSVATQTASFHSLRNDQIFGYADWQPVWTKDTARANVIEEDKHLYDEAFQHMLRPDSGGRLQMEVRIKWPDDTIHWVYKLGQLFYDADGKPLNVAGIVMDITERKVLERQKEVFIGIASHELKTPVTSIKAYAQILHAQFLEAEDQVSASLLEKLDRQVDRLTNLIRDLLDVTRIAEGQLTLHEEPVDLNDLINEVAEDMQRSASRHAIIKDLLPLPAMKADKERLGQVLTNLISNAIKYSPAADKINISTHATEDSIVVTVQDYGIGMSIEARQKVFDQFFRVKDSKNSTFPGLGLGLFISSEIIKRHKGKISVNSTEGAGSTFSFSLPYLKVV